MGGILSCCRSSDVPDAPKPPEQKALDKINRFKKITLIVGFVLLLLGLALISMPQTQYLQPLAAVAITFGAVFLLMGSCSAVCCPSKLPDRSSDNGIRQHNAKWDRYRKMQGVFEDVSGGEVIQEGDPNRIRPAGGETVTKIIKREVVTGKMIGGKFVPIEGKIIKGNYVPPDVGVNKPPGRELTEKEQEDKRLSSKARDQRIKLGANAIQKEKKEAEQLKQLETQRLEEKRLEQNLLKQKQVDLLEQERVKKERLHVAEEQQRREHAVNRLAKVAGGGALKKEEE